MRLFTLSILHSSFITRIYAFFVSLPLFFHYNYCTNSSYIIYMLIIRSKMTPLRIGPRMSYYKMYSVCDNFLLWNQYRDIEWKCLYQLNYYFQGWHMSFLRLYTYKLSYMLWVFLVKKLKYAKRLFSLFVIHASLYCFLWYSKLIFMIITRRET